MQWRLMRRWGQRATVLDLQLLLDTRFGNAKILLVGLKPSLIGVLERRGKGGHDLAAVTQIATDLGPFLGLANSLETAASLNCLFEFV